MSRFRLLPTPEQERLVGHCRDARYVWNLAVEQQRTGNRAARLPAMSSSRAVDRGARRVRVASRGVRRCSSGAAGFRASHAELLRRHAPPPDVAQSRCARRVSAGRGETPSRRAAEPPLRSGVGAQGRAGCGFGCRGRCQRVSSPIGSPAIGPAAGMSRSPTSPTRSPGRRRQCGGYRPRCSRVGRAVDRRTAARTQSHRR